ncbi:MAG: hypothetical protein IJB76_06570 [Clostridia bacterium]|nr:hypothetical protein [Clostridia bacterium]
MKRVVSVVLLIAVLFTTMGSIVGCNSFLGGIKAFIETDNFYEKIGNVLLSIVGGSNSSFPLLNDETLELKANVTFDNYTVDDKLMGNGKGEIDLNLLLTEDLDYDLSYAFKGFDDQINTFKRLVQVENKMLVDFGERLSNKPLCYFDEGFNCFTYGRDGLFDIIKNLEFRDDTDGYKLDGKTFKTDTVEFTINSDKLDQWAGDLSGKLYSSLSTQYNDNADPANQVYAKWHYPVTDMWYFIQDYDIHITWKRHFSDGSLCREEIRIHDPNNHSIDIDIAYSEDDDKEIVEISVEGYNGSIHFDIFALSAEKTNTDGGFVTKAKAIIGDEILITATNSGNELKSEGTANINLYNVIGEQSFPISYSYSAERVGEGNNGLGLDQSFVFDIDNLLNYTNDRYISCDLEINLCASLTDKAPIIDYEGDYYDLGTLSDIYYHNTVGEDIKTAAIDAFTSYLNGDKPDFVNPGPYVEDFELEITYDDGTVYETDGLYGKEYIDILNSDKYMYKFTYNANVASYPMCSAVLCRDGDKKMFSYDYSDGTEYDEFHDGMTIYEVHHDIKTIIYSTYDEENYIIDFPDTVYNYYQSGYCEYDNRKLVYEKYYDYSNNKYTLIFDEEKKPELMVIESSIDGSFMYTYLEEISADVPGDAFEIADYEKVSALDFYQ